MDDSGSLTTEAAREDWWTNIADMMSGLMMIFLFIAISYMASVQKAATSYFDLQANLYQDLQKEFSGDLTQWKARIDPKTAAVRFEEPDVLFEPGSAEIRPAFQAILKDFFPRYLRIVEDAKYKSSVDEIRIEGHTSSDWLGQTGTHDAYFHNMRLSQDRTRSVLEFVWSLTSARQQDWMKSSLTANGLSFSKPVLDQNGAENKQLSRRVEFRVRMRAEDRMKQMAAQR